MYPTCPGMKKLKSLLHNLTSLLVNITTFNDAYKISYCTALCKQEQRNVGVEPTCPGMKKVLPT